MTTPPLGDAPTAGPHPWLVERTIRDLELALAAGETSAHDLARMYLERIGAIDRDGPRLSSVIETNPDALEIANALDRAGAAGATGPLHGIPILLKDNIETADAMETTAGSVALLGARPSSDAFVAARLRAAGAVLLGKTNLSEWANFRSTRSSGGWSARGGLCLNPYAHAVGVQLGVGGGGGGQSRGRSARHRDRRLDPQSRGGERDRRS
jgi:amidase